MEIADSARKHGIADLDILHAIAVPVRQIRQDDDRLLVLGADRAGRLLEIVILDPRGRTRRHPRHAASTEVPPILVAVHPPNPR